MSFANLTNITDFMSLVAYANARTDGWMFLSVLIGVYLIALAVFIRFGKSEAFIVASFADTILAFVFSQAGLMDFTWVIVSFLALCIATLVQAFKPK